MSTPKPVEKALKMIKDHEVKFIDMRFTDTRGKEQHMSISAQKVDETFFGEGKMFDGSSIAGWREIHDSDMILMPDPETVFIDPFFEEPTLVVRCDIVDPETMKGYERDPRSLAKGAEAYMATQGIADACLLGPEPEFFIFDDVRWGVDITGARCTVNSHEGHWNSETAFPDGNSGHRPQKKGGYFPVPPVDSAQDIRSAMCLLLEDMGLKTETHHHEVATGGQQEINVACNTLTKKADEVQMLKYVVHNVAHAYGKTATFMPKPLVGDNGSGMHCHLSLTKDGKNIFAGDGYAGLSEEALYFIGGVIKHARALNAFTNASTNSYKRLVPGFEAPVLLAYSYRNRSAAVRIPHTTNAQARRIEIRFPDPTANPYLAFSAILMAGLDGIRNKIHPGDPSDKDLYAAGPEEIANIPTVCTTLAEALDALDQDRAFLLEGNVFTDDLIDSYIALKQEEVQRLRMTTHPVEFDMYYSL